MKLPSLLVVTGLLASAVVGYSADSAMRVSAQSGLSRGEAWLNSYYGNPQPDELPRAVYSLSREGYFDQAGQPAQAIGFFSEVFAKNPDRVNYWFAQFSGLPERHQRVLAAALWYAGNPRGERMLTAMSSSSDADVRASVERLLAQGATRVEDTPVLSESSMNLQWGAFLASGNEKHITNILAAVGSGQPGINEAARLSLAMNAAAHPRVMEICRTQLDKQPNEVRSVLRAALNEAEARKGTQPTS